MIADLPHDPNVELVISQPLDMDDVCSPSSELPETGMAVFSPTGISISTPTLMFISIQLVEVNMSRCLLAVNL